jgi:L-lactate dehydrogenase complex protein LldG
VTTKDIVLARIRAALGETTVAPEIPRDYRRTSIPADLDLLVDRLVDYKATVHRIKTGKAGGEGDAPANGTAAAIRGVISEIVGGGALVVPAGLPEGWLPPEVEALVDDGLPVEAIGGADGVVTGAAVAVAETGTIVLDASGDQGRRIITLLPDLHICVVRADQVVASVPEAVGRLDPRRPLTWISGPSATSDIELNRVEGVHGPRRLHVILVEP